VYDGPSLCVYHAVPCDNVDYISLSWGVVVAFIIGVSVPIGRPEPSFDGKSSF